MASTSCATACRPRPFSAHDAVWAYKSLVQIKRAFRNCKRTRLEVRPLYVFSAEYVRARIFLCALAYQVAWRWRLAPTILEDQDCAGARAKRTWFVRKETVTGSTQQVAGTRITPDGLPPPSMRTLPDHLGSLTLIQVALTGNLEHTSSVTTEPTPLQQPALQLLEPGSRRMFPVDVQAP